MINHYLYIENGKFNWLDGVFSGIAKVAQDKVSDFCREKADKMRNSNLRNYDYLTTEQRERLAKLWESAINLPVGNYDYYFNLEDKTETFIKSVQELAEKLGIDYELIIKDYAIKECKITEDYCSQKVVKLLKDEIGSSDLSYIWEDNKVTHQMAMKILRDVYDIHISVSYSFFVNDIDNKPYLVYVRTKERHTSYKAWYKYHSTYEEAVEAALKYALEVLIGGKSEDYDEKIIELEDRINQLEIRKD